MEDVIDILDFDPFSNGVNIGSKHEQVKEFHNFMSRSSGSGNFEPIFPFNEETHNASIAYSDHLDREEQENIIIKNVEAKFGKRYTPPKVIKNRSE